MAGCLSGADWAEAASGAKEAITVATRNDKLVGVAIVMLTTAVANATSITGRLCRATCLRFPGRDWGAGSGLARRWWGRQQRAHGAAAAVEASLAGRGGEGPGEREAGTRRRDSLALPLLTAQLTAAKTRRRGIFATISQQICCKCKIIQSWRPWASSIAGVTMLCTSLQCHAVFLLDCGYRTFGGAHDAEALLLLD